MLNILVTVKVVPKPEEVKVDQETKTLDRGNARSEINPADMAVIETALKLKDKYGANVTVLSMGPPFADKFIKVAMAMGCDNGVLLTDRVLAGADTLATSYALAKAIDAIGDQDLVI
ncbi:MAG TPA: electron transfer flavoprotein beta subunit/FixA family protein, partial [Candidatus Marinimicrobia bacterium]|nr:electron transfer flavoprotein beta subunit/FixA family protein [Candidatus Neomarinimicrobiota bacterium]